MHIKIYFAAIDQADLSRYEYLQLTKAAKKGLINDYLHKMIYSISLLQDNSSEFVE